MHLVLFYPVTLFTLCSWVSPCALWRFAKAQKKHIIPPVWQPKRRRQKEVSSTVRVSGAKDEEGWKPREAHRSFLICTHGWLSSWELPTGVSFFWFPPYLASLAFLLSSLFHLNSSRFSILSLLQASSSLKGAHCSLQKVIAFPPPYPLPLSLCLSLFLSLPLSLKIMWFSGSPIQQLRFVFSVTSFSVSSHSYLTFFFSLSLPVP